MDVRQPAVAGQFYDENPELCVGEIEECLEGQTIEVDLPAEIVAGIVPHAGWVFSGDLAAMVFSGVKRVHEKVDTFVILGAAHRYLGREAAVYAEGKWQTPLGQIDIDEDLAGRISGIDCACADEGAHRGEHSIEVQVPFIQHLFPEAAIVPVIVPSAEFDVSLGTEIGEIILDSAEKKIVCIASTDLTHYGPRYGFSPQGTGPEGIKWAKEVNDMEFIELALAMEAHKLLETAVEKDNACGPGAVATAISVAQRLGKTEGILLGHTHSNEVMERRFGQTSDESVGYVAIIY